MRVFRAVPVPSRPRWQPTVAGGRKPPLDAARPSDGSAGGESDAAIEAESPDANLIAAAPELPGRAEDAARRHRRLRAHHQPRGSLIQRGGTYHFQKRVAGKLYRKALGVPVKGAAEKALAERRANEFELSIRNETFGYEKPIAPTLNAWWETYDKTYMPLKSVRTQARDRGTMKLHAVPYFGDKRLDQITKSDCVGYLNARRAAFAANPGRKSPTPIAEGTVTRERQLLQAVFARAIEDGLIVANPWKGIKRTPYLVRDRVLLEDEQAKLLAVLTPRYQRFVQFCLGTGVRLDEVRTIDPRKHLDLDHRTVTVLGKGRKWRTIPLAEPVAAVAKAQLDAEGRLWRQNPQRLREVVGDAAKRVGIPHLSPHALRHTFGWRWLKSGGNVYVLSKLLGHASVQVTERHYGHLLKEDLHTAMDARDLGIDAP